MFEENFNTGFEGWTVVQPRGAYLDGPLRWEYDIVNPAFLEQSNVYTDSATVSPTATAPMLINATVTAVNFTFSARLIAGDDDGFGLIFGYLNETNFYRVTFARQSRTTGFPWTGWSVDRKVNDLTTTVFGAGTPSHVPTFVNSTGQPFDVTIAVNTANRLTLTVVDNPQIRPVTYTLVTNQPLPGSASGKVGLMTWGMAGGNPRGFRIENLNLEPATLAGKLERLTNWMAVVPPRSNGSSALSGGAPLWSLSVGTAGPSGALSESSDSMAGNDTPGQVDFTGPTLVAGDSSWTDYTLAVRMIPGDDDGQGILVRYRNPTNFCRISLRNQVSSIGAPAGLSVQRCVDGQYTEAYRETSVKYYPAPNVPYDLMASVKGDSLELLLVSSPDGPAQVYAYGPFDLTGLSSGKIGLFSWAMSRAEFDSVTVHDGTPLYVTTPYGTPQPARGLSSFVAGTVLEASAGPAITNRPGTRRWPVGWSGTGSVPASGTGSNVVFTLETISHLHWHWQTEYRLTVTNGPGGTVSFPLGEWFLEGTSVALSAEPAPGYVFARWQGDLLSTSANLSLLMDKPYAVAALFAPDSDRDGLPDEWELANFGSLLFAAGDDPDNDGRSNAQEFAAGSNPSVADIFCIQSLFLTNSQAVLVVSNNTGARYDVLQAPVPRGGWSTIGTTQFTSVFTSTVPTGTSGFWRLRQAARPPEALPFVPGSWTLAVLPDIQVYSERYPDLLQDQVRWLIANKQRFNIQYAVQLGDIVNYPTAVNQWSNAQRALRMLDGWVPYALVTGNHDHGTTGVGSDRATLVNNYFPAANYRSWPTFGGTMENDRIENSYHLFTAGGVDWLLLALEWGPRNATVAWANEVVNAYPKRKVILVTHAYLYNDDSRYDWSAKGASQIWSPYSYGTVNDPGGTNDGEDLWNKLVRIHPGFVMVLSGHVLNDGLGRLSSTNDFGGMVHQMLVNYQMQPLGGAAFLRLIEFLPDGQTVQVKGYSPLNGGYKTDSENQFVLKLQPRLAP